MGQESGLLESRRRANWWRCLRSSELAGDGRRQFSGLLPGQSVRLRGAVSERRGARVGMGGGH